MSRQDPDECTGTSGGATIFSTNFQWTLPTGALGFGQGLVNPARRAQHDRQVDSVGRRLGMIIEIR